MLGTDRPARGPKLHRLGVYALSFLLWLLLVWLGFFALDDIDSIPAPALVDDKGLLTREEQIRKEGEQLDLALEVETEKQAYLRDSSEASQQTLDQLIALRQAHLDKNMPITEAESAAFMESQQTFIRNQEQAQATMERILQLKAEKRASDDALRKVQEEIRNLRTPILEHHRLKLAFLKFLALAPFVALGCWLFVRSRKGNYAPLAWAFDAAVLFLVVTVIHQHFPARYFKYMFLGLAIGVVLTALIYIIRQFSRPSAKWLLQRYREAYNAAKCPICHFPIVGENLMALAQPDKRFLRRNASQSAGDSGKARAYTCPSCGSRLFERCGHCQEVRHTLLPHCSYCGAKADAPGE